MATLADIVSDLRLYTLTDATVLPTAVAEEAANTAIRRMSRRHNFRFQMLNTDLSYTAGADFVALPTDFVKEQQLSIKDTTQTDPSRALTPLVKTDRGNWIESLTPQGQTDSIFPSVAAPTALTPQTYYYFWAQQLYRVPTPTSAQTLTLDYWQRPADLTGSGTNGFITVYRDVVRALALVDVYAFLHEDERQVAWATLGESMLLDAIRHDETLAFSGSPRSRGRG